MATRQLKVLKEKGTHAVGNLNSIKIRTLSHGAMVVGADVDNFTVVELGHDAEGQRTAKQLSDAKKKSYLIATPELLNMGEARVDFYNAVGELARIVYLDEGLRFDSSAYVLDAAVTEVKNGQVAHFDPASKKFLIHAGAHADYAEAKAKFLVVSSDEEIQYTNGAPQVRFEVIES